LEPDHSFPAAFGRLIKRLRGEQGLTQQQLAEKVWPVSANGESRKGDISKLETGKSNPHADTVQRLADVLSIAPDDIDTLRHRATLSLSAQLNDIAVLTRDELELLASRFELDKPHAASDAALKQFLTDKAVEYRAYRAQIESIDSRTAGLGNLKSAARDAAERLDFAEVEAMLSRVDQVETEIAAETKELRAANFLLQGRVDDAYQCYAAAAAGFVSVDPLEAARRRANYAISLCEHGLRFGGTGISYAIDLCEASLVDLSATTTPEMWAATQNNLAIALRNQAAREQGAARTTLLSRSDTAFEAALSVYAKGDKTVDWAKTQSNLAVALRDQASRKQGAAAATLLSRATAIYELVLTVQTKADHPLEWAATKNNLANALSDQAKREHGAASTDLLFRAAEAYEEALTVRTKADHPLQWALTQNNLAITLRHQAARDKSTAGNAIISRAVAAYEAVLSVRTKSEHPLHWAVTQSNLANALCDQAAREKGTTGITLLSRAVAAYNATLTVHTKTDHPLDWARIQNNLANALCDQAAREQGAAGSSHLFLAVAGYGAALTVYTETDHPLDWAMTKNNLAIAEMNFSERRECPDASAALHRALAHVDDALTVYDPIHTAPIHAKATRLRHAILDALSRL
jgi:transcriptional regulator with XRE-family HTH domain